MDQKNEATGKVHRLWTAPKQEAKSLLELPEVAQILGQEKEESGDYSGPMRGLLKGPLRWGNLILPGLSDK